MLLKHKSTIKDALSVHRGVTRRVKWAQSWVLLSPSYAKLYCWVLLQPTAGSVVSVGLTWLDLQYAEPSIHAWADPFRLFFPLGGKRDRSCSIFEVRRRRHLQKLMMEASVLCVCVREFVRVSESLLAGRPKATMGSNNGNSYGNCRDLWLACLSLSASSWMIESQDSNSPQSWTQSSLSSHLAC